jgi:hypothetical protein
MQRGSPVCSPYCASGACYSACPNQLLHVPLHVCLCMSALVDVVRGSRFCLWHSGHNVSVEWVRTVSGAACSACSSEVPRGKLASCCVHGLYMGRLLAG